MKAPRYSSALGRLRVEAGFTQPEVARRLKVAPITISRWERGTCKLSSEIRHRLARLYRLTWQQILEAEVNHEGGET